MFIFCLGFYVTPAVLGGGRVIMVANRIANDIEIFFNWGAASALGVVLLVLTLIVLFAASRLVRLDRLFGGHGHELARPIRLRTRRSRIGARLWLYLLAAAIMAFLVLPTIIVIPMSFSASQYLEFPPREWSLRWYANYVSSPPGCKRPGPRSRRVL